MDERAFHDKDKKDLKLEKIKISTDINWENYRD